MSQEENNTTTPQEEPEASTNTRVELGYKGSSQIVDESSSSTKGCSCYVKSK